MPTGGVATTAALGAGAGTAAGAGAGAGMSTGAGAGAATGMGGLGAMGGMGGQPNGGQQASTSPSFMEGYTQAAAGTQQRRMGMLMGGYGLYQMYKGAEAQRQAELQKGASEAQIKGTRYADYNQAYYNELQRRQSVGLPQEQQAYMEQMADRSAGVALGAMDDRRAGLMGIGAAQQNLASAYRNIGLADVAAREANAQAVLGEMSNRGTSTYNEQLRNAGIDLANAIQKRQEGFSQQQAGTQNVYGGLTSVQEGNLNNIQGAGYMTTAALGANPTVGGMM